MQEEYILFPAEVKESCSISKYNFLWTPYNIFPKDNWFQNYQREISNERNLIPALELNSDGLNYNPTVHRNNDK